MRSGKTNMVNFIIENAVRYYYHIYTNIIYFETEDEIEQAKKLGILDKDRTYQAVHPNIHKVTKASELIKGLYTTHKNLTVLDEAHFFAGSARGNAKIVRWFKELVTQIGKLDSCMILLTQVKSELARTLKKKLPSHEIKIIKINWNIRRAEIFFVPEQIGDDREDPVLLKTWDRLPLSAYPFDTKAPAMFEFDIDMEKLLTEVSTMNSVVIREKILGIIDKMLHDQEKKNEKKVTKRDGIIKDLNDGFSTKETSERNDAPFQYVKNIKSEISVMKK